MNDDTTVWATGKEEGLKPEEACACIRLTPLIGPLRWVDCPGAAQKTHDFEAEVQAGLAAIEVTSETNSQLLGVWSEIDKSSLGQFAIAGPLSWHFSLQHNARVSTLSSEELEQLRQRLVQDGRRYWTYSADPRDPVDREFRRLGISHVHAIDTPEASNVFVSAAGFGGRGWTGEAVDTWVAGFLDAKLGRSKLKKLADSGAQQQHLVVVLNFGTDAALGIPLGLIARRERAVDDYKMPTFQPSEPLTHLWLVPSGEMDEGLKWSCEAGWGILPAYRTDEH